MTLKKILFQQQRSEHLFYFFKILISVINLHEIFDTVRSENNKPSIISPLKLQSYNSFEHYLISDSFNPLIRRDNKRKTDIMKQTWMNIP